MASAEMAARRIVPMHAGVSPSHREVPRAGASPLERGVPTKRRHPLSLTVMMEAAPLAGIAHLLLRGLPLLLRGLRWLTKLRKLKRCHWKNNPC